MQINKFIFRYRFFFVELCKIRLKTFYNLLYNNCLLFKGKYSNLTQDYCHLEISEVSFINIDKSHFLSYFIFYLIYQRN